MKPLHLPKPVHLLLMVLGMLGGCGAITVKTDPGHSEIGRASCRERVF